MIPQVAFFLPGAVLGGALLLSSISGLLLGRAMVGLPRWNPQLAALHERELARGNRNRATLAVARKLVAYLLAVDKSGQPFAVRSAPAAETEVQAVA
ncbi:MAG: hypothetical protein ABSH37_09505 [Bryobacteraceae bacterium]